MPFTSFSSVLARVFVLSSALPHFAAALPSGQQQQHVFNPNDRQPAAIDNDTVSGWGGLGMVSALEVLQEEYFKTWQGTWSSAIDWTAAVLGTHIPATLSLISSLNLTEVARGTQQSRENVVNRYFSQLIAFYYGQDWLSLRTQANDDMLWVVLGWLEAVTFTQSYSQQKHAEDEFPWYGQSFVPAFGHRARIFWEIASDGWDETLCGGGMIWNPKLVPYKNAITNQLYVAASISMYLYFPGDDNDLPYGSEEHKFKQRDEKYLKAALKAYDWLMTSNMLNHRGLFVDGYHVRGWRDGRDASNGTARCDERNEMVYTYNQGVILTGQRGLFLATEDRTYLDQGHLLISNAIAATGWNLESDTAEEDLVWKGLGRLGVLEEECDILGTCSQDGQAFKGIFFLHYAAFCSPLPPAGPSASSGYGSIQKVHLEQCRRYGRWVEHNAQAASKTKDGKGLFSMWWTEGVFPDSDEAALERVRCYGPAHAGADYRNDGIPDNDAWRPQDAQDSSEEDAVLFTRQEMWRQLSLADDHNLVDNPLHLLRSAEIQSGGLSVLRADMLHKEILAKIQL